MIGLRKRGEWGIGHGVGEQIFEPGGHLVHGQGPHIQPDFELIVIVRPHDSDDGRGIRVIGENFLCSKFGNGGVESAPFSRNVQQGGEVREAGMRGATVDRAHAGFNGLELIQGFP